MDINTIEKVAFLARVQITEVEAEEYSRNLSSVLVLLEQLDNVDMTGVEPLFHPLEITQPTRPDQVTAIDERAAFQSIAPSTEAGLYLVPQVIEEDEEGK